MHTRNSAPYSRRQRQRSAAGQASGEARRSQKAPYAPALERHVQEPMPRKGPSPRLKLDRKLHDD